MVSFVLFSAIVCFLFCVWLGCEKDWRWATLNKAT